MPRNLNRTLTAVDRKVFFLRAMNSQLDHRLFGKEGFEAVVVKKGELEKRHDIYDLWKFTPRT